MTINMGIGNTNYKYPYSIPGDNIPSQDREAARNGVVFPGGETAHASRNPGESTVKSPGRKSSPAECETCKNRKYQDGSDEMVSFKSAAHVSPESAGTRVRAHEQEHVSNAFKKASMNNGKVLSATVSIHTSVCPECGRTYVSGGETATQIKYYNEENPYQKGKKTADSSIYAGMNLDLAV